MGNVPAAPIQEQDQEELPHKLLLETHTGGQRATASLTCTAHGAILECDTELWFKSKNASVALSSLANKDKHACDWLTFDLQVARANEQCDLISRANVLSDMEGVATVVRSETSACELARDQAAFSVDRCGWYQLRGDTSSNVCFAVEVGDKEVLRSGGSSFCRFLQLSEKDLVRVFVCSPTRDVLTRPREVSFSMCFHAEVMLSDSMFIGIKQRQPEEVEADVRDDQSDISFED